MKPIYLSLILMFVIGCSRDAFQSKLKSNVVNFGNNNISSLSTNVKVSPELRDATLVVFPNEEDVEGAEFRPDIDPRNGLRASRPLWNLVFGQLKDKNGIPMVRKLSRGFSKLDSAPSKINVATQTILSASQAQDFGRTMQLPYLQLIRMEKKISERYACYYYKKVGAKRFCETGLRPGESETPRNPRRPKNCRQIKAIEFQDARNPNRAEALNRRLAQDRRLCARKPALRRLYGAFFQYRQASKGVVLQMYQYLEAVSFRRGQLKKFIHIVCNATMSGSCPNSKIVFGEGNRSIKEFSLMINFRDRFGMQEYSLKNGKITNFAYNPIGAGGNPVVNFTILHDDEKYQEKFVVAAELSVTNTATFDVRLVGDGVKRYADGRAPNKVAFKLEMDIDRD